MTQKAMIEREGAVLLGWLRLLGWSVVIERQGARWAGSARRSDASGAELSIGGSAESRRELVSKLFRDALGHLEPQIA